MPALTPGAEVRALRKSLEAILDEISRLTVERAPARCPYRARGDVCTFSGPCRNRRRASAESRCSGDPLDPSPAGRRDLPQRQDK